MKTLFFVLVMIMSLVMVTFVSAKEVRFIWNANTEKDLKGYRLYQSSKSGVYNKKIIRATILAGTQKAKINVTREGTHFWVLTAFDRYGNESGFSNEVKLYLNLSAPKTPLGFQRE